MSVPPPRSAGGRTNRASWQAATCAVQARGWACSRAGRFGVVTNFRELERAAPDAPSRGDLVAGFLGAPAASPLEYLDSLRLRASRYAGFNLLLGGPDALYYHSNRDGQEPRRLERGMYGLSNHWLDSPWPKLLRSRARLAELVAADRVEPEALFALLADRTPADLDETPDTGLPPDWERALSSPFVSTTVTAPAARPCCSSGTTVAPRCSSDVSTRPAR